MLAYLDVMEDRRADISRGVHRRALVSTLVLVIFLSEIKLSSCSWTRELVSLTRNSSSSDELAFRISISDEEDCEE